MSETNSEMRGCKAVREKIKQAKAERKAKREAKTKRQREQARAKQLSKISQSKTKEQLRIDALTHYDLTSYDDDIDVMASVFNIGKSRREWIVTARMELQERANKYEHIFGNFLLKHNVHFIHQAPFVVDGHIYFADLYLPEKRIVVEIDGDYHDGHYQRAKDRDRTDDLKFAGAKVVRIKNATTLEESNLKTKCKINGII